MIFLVGLERVIDMPVLRSCNLRTWTGRDVYLIDGLGSATCGMDGYGYLLLSYGFGLSKPSWPALVRGDKNS